MSRKQLQYRVIAYAALVLAVGLIPQTSHALAYANPQLTGLDKCGSVKGDPCYRLGAQRECKAGSNVRCVTCEDSNGDGLGHWSAPHLCTVTIVPEGGDNGHFLDDTQ